MNVRDKHALLDAGIARMQAFCRLNDIFTPAVIECARLTWIFNECAYYRNKEISICIEKCATVSASPRAWSYPGYSTDRTPYGVIAHELGHHVDVIKSTRKGNYYGDFSLNMRADTNAPPLTSYCPNDAEWFAEMFRLFVTNADLLQAMRPTVHAALLTAGFKPIFGETWRDVLRDAPDRFENAIMHKIVPR